MRRISLTSILLCVGTIVVFTNLSPALAADFNGSWSDNAADGRRLGTMKVAPGAIEFRHFARYEVVTVGSFGKGNLFKVTGVDHRPDPMGCGPTDSVTYIAITAIAPVSGTSRRGANVLFYGGGKAPDPSTIDDDPASCGTHPFGRGG